MNLKIDGTRFDELQGILIGGIIEEVKAALASSDLSEVQMRDLLGKISFSVAAVLDGSRSVESEGVEINPIITFKEGDSLIYAGGSSWMHEYVFGVIAEVYGE